MTSVSIVSVASFFFGFADVLEYTFLTRNEVDAFICFTAGVKVHCMFDAGAYFENSGLVSKLLNVQSSQGRPALLLQCRIGETIR